MALLSRTGTEIPLSSLHVEITVVDVCYKVQLQQKYVNTGDASLEVLYKFSLGDLRGFLGDFEAKIGDKTYKGDVKEKGAARDQYDDAIASGKAAALVEKVQTGSNVFIANLGNLEPSQECDIVVTYYAEVNITQQGKMEVRVPMATLPDVLCVDDETEHSTTASVLKEGMGISATVKTTNKVKAVECKSHALKFSLGDEGTVSVSTTAAEPLKEDFVLLVETADTQDTVAWLQTSEDAADHVEAAMVFINPWKIFKDNAAAVKPLANGVTKEILFVVDCSGSMSSFKRYLQARDAMQVFLRALPEDVRFNIIKFGSSYETLWKTSQQYSDETLEEASNYVKSINADLGCTDLDRPLRDFVYKTLAQGEKASACDLFILTDGFVDDFQQTKQTILKNTHHARVFCVGLGSGASRFQVREFARIGGGTAEFADDQPKGGETLNAKIQRQLAAAEFPSLSNVKVEWIGKKDFALSGVECYSGANQKQQEEQQAPVFSGQPFMASVVLLDITQPKGTAKTPTIAQVRNSLRAKVTAVGPPPTLKQLEYTLNFGDEGTTKLTSDDFVSRVTAAKMIELLEDQLSPITGDHYNLPKQAEVKKQIAALGVRFRLATSCTSFVAIAATNNQAAGGAMKTVNITAGEDQVQRNVSVSSWTSSYASSDGDCDAYDDDDEDEDECDYAPRCADSLDEEENCWMNDEDNSEDEYVLKGKEDPCREKADEMEWEESEDEAVCRKQKKKKNKKKKNFSPPQSPKSPRSGSPRSGSRSRSCSPMSENAQSPPAFNTTVDIVKVAMEQKASGAWLLTDTLCKVLGTNQQALQQLAPNSQVDLNIWCTCVVISWLQVFASTKKVEWELLVKKARAWLQKQAALDTDQLLAAAKRAVKC